MGWTQPGQRDWNDFYRRLTSGHLERLGAMGIRFRMFPPQTEYRSGVVTVTPEIAGVEIRYTTDLSEPDESSALYTEPLRTDRPDATGFRAFGCGGYSTAVFPVAELSGRSWLQPNNGFQGAVERLRDPRRALAVVVHAAAGQCDDRAARSERPGYGLYDYSKRAKINPLRDLRLIRRFGEPHGRPAGHAENNSSKREELTLNLRPSPYIEPAVSVTSSLTCSGNFRSATAPITNFHLTYVRFPPARRAIISCSRSTSRSIAAIDVRTGLPDVTRYIVTDGTAACSADGKTFGEEIPLKPDGSVVLRPSAPVPGRPHLDPGRQWRNDSRMAGGFAVVPRL